jgi:hypothetical protein
MAAMAGRQSYGKHAYVVPKMPVEQMTRFIEDRMMHLPVRKSN